VAITFPASGSVVTPDTFSIATSSSVQAGDLLIFQVAFNDINDEPAPPTGPGSGEARVDSGTFYFFSSPAHQSYWYTAVAAGGSETYTWSPFNDGNHMNITYVAVRGCSTTLEAHNGAIHSSASGSHTSDSVTATDTSRVLLLMVGLTSQPTNDVSATGYTQLIDTQDNNGTTNVEIYAGHKSAVAGAQTATFALNTEAEKACSMLFVLTPAGGQSAATGTATETDAAVALGRLKTRSVSTAAEADAAVAVGRTKRRTLGVATETDATTALARAKAKAAGAATSAETGQALGRRKTKALSTAAETNTALTVSTSSAHLVGRADEADAAAVLGRAKVRTVGTATALEAALLLARRKVCALGIALELDAAAAFAGAPLHDLQLVVGPPEPAWAAGLPDSAWGAAAPAAAWTTQPPEA
jgi:hypothetical protein